MSIGGSFRVEEGESEPEGPEGEERSADPSDTAQAGRGRGRVWRLERERRTENGAKRADCLGGSGPLVCASHPPATVVHPDAATSAGGIQNQLIDCSG